MREHLLFAYSFNLGKAARLVGDLTDEQMVQQPQGVINHPAWTLGHLAWVANHLAGLLGADAPLPDGWAETFKPGGTPSSHPGRLSIERGHPRSVDRAARRGGDGGG